MNNIFFTFILSFISILLFSLQFNWQQVFDLLFFASIANKTNKLINEFCGKYDLTECKVLFSQ